MGRIHKGYEARFRGLLARLNARKVDKAVLWFRSRACRKSEELNLSMTAAVAHVFNGVDRRRALTRGGLQVLPERFWCDAGLGGLARWLRAAGYEAAWEPDIDDNAVLARARQTGATLLTTDSMLMERRLLRDRIIPALWIPPAFGIREQLRIVLREFDLPLRPARCMDCGGELQRGEKEILRDRIPPRTYRWRDEYFVCTRCQKLYWHGTHWRRIQSELQSVTGEAAGG